MKPNEKTIFIYALAQATREIIPEAVSKNPKDGFLSLNTTPIFWAIVNAVKELNARAGGHEDRLKVIERELLSLKLDKRYLSRENERLRLRLGLLEASR